MASAYLFHLVAGHPFVDGNERVGLLAANTFLALNRVDVTAPEDAYADLVLSVARGERTKTDVAAFLRANSVRREPA